MLYRLGADRRVGRVGICRWAVSRGRRGSTDDQLSYDHVYTDRVRHDTSLTACTYCHCRTLPDPLVLHSHNRPTRSCTVTPWHSTVHSSRTQHLLSLQ